MGILSRADLSTTTKQLLMIINNLTKLYDKLKARLAPVSPFLFTPHLKSSQSQSTFYLLYYSMTLFPWGASHYQPTLPLCLQTSVTKLHLVHASTKRTDSAFKTLVLITA